MSQHDDELLTTLRAELARRASTTPREGFDARIAAAVHDLHRPRGRGLHRLVPAGVALATVAVVAAVLVLGLRAHQQNRGATPAPAPTPAATVLYAERVSPGGSGSDELRFLRPDGSTVRTVPLPKGDTADNLTTGGGQVFWVTTGAFHLLSMGVDGVPHDHGVLPGASAGFGSLVVSPDGRRWAWTRREVVYGASTITDHWSLHVAGEGQPDRVVVNRTVQSASAQGDRDTRAVAWTAAGVVVVREPVGIGGYVPFDAWSSPELVDLGTGAVHPLAGCTRDFDDIAPDGSYACGTDAATLTVFDRNGGVRRRIDVAQPRSQVGNARISHDGSRVAIKVQEGTDEPCTDSCRFRSDVVDVANGRVSHPPAGYVPLAWLDDGSLVTFRPGVPPGADAATLRSAQLVIRPDGAAVPIGPDEWIGVVRP
jgi:hypothetical protein